MPAGNGRLHVESVEEAGDWSDIAAARILDDVAAALSRNIVEAEGTVTVALADDRTAHDLNRRFRGVDRPTNVLSFPSGEVAGRRAYLGDVVLAAETLRREAATEGKLLNDHFAHLVLHGVLHLLGYDHQGEDEAAIMEGLESAILAELGIPDPYGQEPAVTSET